MCVAIDAAGIMGMVRNGDIVDTMAIHTVTLIGCATMARRTGWIGFVAHQNLVRDMAMDTPETGPMLSVGFGKPGHHDAGGVRVEG